MSSPTSPTCVFVYGTLRKDLSHDMYHVLARNAAFVGEATVQGRLYSLGEYPGLVLSAPSSHIVKGEVYRLTDARLKETLAILDDYEGIGPGDPAPHEYRRELTQVTLADGQLLTAWAYVLNRQPEGRPLIPTGDYAQWRASRGEA